MSIIQFFPSRAIALNIFGFGIHWYGLLYLFSFIIAYYAVQTLQRYRHLALTKAEWSDIISYSVLGVLIGGRLGYVLLYEPAFYSTHVLEIFYVWRGGMSFHGGLIGTSLALLYACEKYRLSFLTVLDVAIVPIAIGLALGRLGNFINLELYGTVTTLPWGIAIPNIEGMRHPTQIYAMGKDVLIAFVCYNFLKRTAHKNLHGMVTGIFLVLYGCLRFAIEFFRVPTHSLIKWGALTFTRGQLYSIPVCLLGIGLIVYSLQMYKRRPMQTR